jgi:hypothetical protein
MKKISFAAFAFLAAAIIVLTSTTDAKAQLFGGRSKVVVNNATGGPVNVRVQENRGLFGGRQNVVVNNGFQQVQVQQNRGGPVRRLLGGIFNRQQVTEVNVGQPAFVRQNIVVQNHHAFNQQLIRQRNVVFQTNNLNTFSYAHNNAAAIRFVQAQHNVYVQPVQVVAPVRVQQYAVPAQIQAPVIVQEVTQPCPQCVEPAPQVIPPAAPTAVDPNVQYSTAQPQRVIQRSVVVQRPVAITGSYYVQSAPVRVRQFVQTGCGY